MRQGSDAGGERLECCSGLPARHEVGGGIEPAARTQACGVIRRNGRTAATARGVGCVRHQEGLRRWNSCGHSASACKFKHAQVLTSVARNFGSCETPTLGHDAAVPVGCRVSRGGVRLGTGIGAGSLGLSWAWRTAADDMNECQAKA